MSLNWNFQRGGGGGYKPKSIPGGSMDIFWNNKIQFQKLPNFNQGDPHVNYLGESTDSSIQTSPDISDRLLYMNFTTQFLVLPVDCC